MTCVIPPPGWKCTREGGHEGPCAAVPDTHITLEEYLKREYAEGKIEFVLRIATIHEGVVQIYIHPLGKDGNTTPTLIVEGDTVRARFF